MKKKSAKNPLYVGGQVLIRTVTHYHTGRVAEITKDGVLLVDAAWIGDTGRFSVALSSGSLSEVEPFPGPVLVMRPAIVDITAWTHPLPRETK